MIEHRGESRVFHKGVQQSESCLNKDSGRGWGGVHCKKEGYNVT